MRAYLIIKQENQEEFRFQLDANQQVTIGRNNFCTLYIPDQRMSGTHCVIDSVGDSFYIRDLNSSNGTFIGNHPIQEQQLFGGEEIVVGRTQLWFHYEAEAVINEATLPDEDMPASAEEEPKMPEKIGEYQVLRKIGQGGVGIVWQVRSLTDPSRIMALKILTPQAQHNRRAVERFLREAKICQTFDHPLIVKVFELGEYLGQPYFSMEYIDGFSLTEYIAQKGAFSPLNALKIAAHVTQALAYAHERGIFHRDLKPGNILLEREAHQVKLIDLGMAKVMLDTNLTMDYCPLGTPRYMSPEQIRNAKEIDGLADIYSLGATMYHMLSGIPPYSEVTVPHKSKLLQHIYNYPPQPLNTLRPLPKPVIALVEKAMARKKFDRFHSATAMYQALRQAVRELKNSPSC